MLRDSLSWQLLMFGIIIGGVKLALDVKYRLILLIAKMLLLPASLSANQNRLFSPLKHLESSTRAPDAAAINKID